MALADQLLFYGGAGLIGLFFGELLDRLCRVLRKYVPYAGTVLDILYYPFKLYTHFWRYLIPDSLYKMWYRAGIMEGDAYRAFQEKGYIRDSLDPQYIQQHDE